MTQLRAVRIGELVTLRGKLVNVRDAQGRDRVDLVDGAVTVNAKFCGWRTLRRAPL